MPKLELDEQHVYRLEGRVLPSVTQVLAGEGILPNHQFTDPFYAERGTAVHEAIRLDLLGQLDEESVDEQIVPYLRNARDSVRSLKLKPLVIEHRMADPIYGYAGTLDLVAWSASFETFVIVDWKSGAIDNGHAIQILGGYVPLLRISAKAGELPVELGNVVNIISGVISLAGNKAKMKWYLPEHGAPAERLFLSALNVHSWKKDNRRLA